MKKIILFAFISFIAPLFGTVFTGTVTGDTYIRNDGAGGPQDGDTDNEFLVGSNGATNNLRGLLRFDASSIISDVNTIGGGNFANLTVNSATLQVFERRGRTNTVNVIVSDYNFAFDPATATWSTPAAGDATAGGTVGSTLGSQSITWDGTADTDDATISLTASAVKTSLQNHLSNNLHLILTTDTPTPNFLSIRSDRDGAQSARFAKLTVDYTVTPAGGPLLTLDPATPHPDYTFPFSQVTASPLTRTLRYENSGASGTITVQNVVVTNTLGTAFSAGTTVPSLPATLAVGESIDIPIIATSATAGSFTGSVFIDTDLDPQDKTLPLIASFYQTGQLFGANASMSTNLASWGGGSTWTVPGMLGISSDGMARVRGNGDPIVPQTVSSHSQAATIPDSLPDWCLDFRFSPAAPAAFADYTGQAADGSFTDRSFQLVVQSTDAVPAPSLTDVLDDNTILNIAYMPDGITTGGVAGFYQFNQGNWELLDFNGDGSPLVLDGSTDVDTDADPLNGIGDGALDSATGDTVNIYRMTIQGSAFGTPSASYSITLTGPGGLNKSVTGLTGYHNQNPTAALPAAFAFITSDTSPDSNSPSGFCPSFWVDEIGYFAVARPAQRLMVFNPPSVLRSLNGAIANHTLSAVNDGTSSAVQLGGSVTGSSAVSLSTTLPVSIAAGQTTTVEVGFDPSQLSAPDTAAIASLDLTSDDPALSSASFAITARKVSDANLVANGDFETDSSAGVFPLAWTATGAPSEVASFLGGGGSAVSLAPNQGILQDLFPAGVAPLADFQADFAIQFGQEAQAHRIRLEGNNGDDLVTLRLIANTASADTIDAFAGGTWTSAFTGLSLDPDTTYFLRVTGRDFGLGTRRFTVALSTDGVNYSVSPELAAFHASPNAAFETVTFECGATAGSVLRVDGVTVVVPPPLDDFDSWMAGFTFEPGADLTAEGDADGDGIANIVENVLGTAPNAPSIGLVGITGTSGTVGFSHPLNPDLASDVGYGYEWSTDLSEWKASGESNAGGTAVDLVPGAPVGGVVPVAATVSSGNTPRLFVRITAVQAAP